MSSFIIVDIVSELIINLNLAKYTSIAEIFTS